MKQIVLLIAVFALSMSANAQSGLKKAEAPAVVTKEAPAKNSNQPVQVTTPTEQPSIQVNFPVEEKSNAKMTFESMVVDYGTVAQNSEPLRLIKFTNTGTDPLIIKNARGSCGCTVPNWPKDPIMPGQSSSIEVRYDTNRIGKINKSITITTNEGDEPHVIQVIGEILKADDQSVPPSTPNIIKGN